MNFMTEVSQVIILGCCAEFELIDNCVDMS